MLNLGAREDGTFALRAERVEDLTAKLVTMNKRAKRTGTAALTLQTVGTELHAIGEGKVLAVAVVRVVGPVPRIADHTFLARVEHHGELGNIVTRAPGQIDASLPLSLRTDDPTCDHCHTRRGRKDTFVLSAPDGTLKRIGRNCLADFLRTADVSDALRMWTLLRTIEAELSDDDGAESWGSSGGGFSGYSVLEFLAAVARCINACGWRSRAAARADGGTSTVDDALTALGPKPGSTYGSAAEEWERMQPTAADAAEAAATIVWGAALTGESDYAANLRIALQLGYVEARNMGLVASAVVSRRKDLAIAFERARRATKPASAHVGVVGKRMELVLTVVRVRHTAGDWGVTTILAMEDAAGNEFTWFASGEPKFELGMQLTGKGTVKKHDTYNGRAQTILSRCKFTVVQPAAAAEQQSA